MSMSREASAHEKALVRDARDDDEAARDLRPLYERDAQLVLEIFVRDLARSLDFYQALGFALERRTRGSAVLSWGDAFLFLVQRPDLVLPASVAARASVRVMVDDVDAYRELATSLRARVSSEIANRSSGLRDFTLLDPDGFGVRFAQSLEPTQRGAGDDQRVRNGNDNGRQ
jgi:catechol 2,3-dioxygenase-like lactoylglutathione lyase family enzyme